MFRVYTRAVSEKTDVVESAEEKGEDDGREEEVEVEEAIKDEKVEEVEEGDIYGRIL
jgi:hypothetical protein